MYFAMQVLAQAVKRLLMAEDGVCVGGVEMKQMPVYCPFIFHLVSFLFCIKYLSAIITKYLTPSLPKVNQKNTLC